MIQRPRLFSPALLDFSRPNKENAKLESLLSQSKIIPVISISDPSMAVPLAKALARGGATVIEVALRTPFAIKAIEEIKKHCPEITVGAATVMTRKEMQDATNAGAHFCASPMYDKSLITFAANNGITYLPCVSSLEQINEAAKAGFKIQKLFPMESLSPDQGERFLRGTATMVNKLQVKFCTSCLETAPENIDQYLKYPAVIATASGWSAPAEFLLQKKWDEIAVLMQKDILRANNAKREITLVSPTPKARL